MKFKIFLTTLIFFANINQSWSESKKELIVKTISGEMFDLSEQKNKVVLVLYWASWCVSCKIEIVDLDKIYKKYKDQGLQIIGLNLDGKVDDAENLSYPIAISSDAKINDFPDPVTIPTAYIVDKQGFSRKFYRAKEVRAKNLEKVIIQLLKADNQ